MKEIQLGNGFKGWPEVQQSWQDWWDGRLDRPLVMYETYQPGWKARNPNAPERPTWTYAGKFALDMPVDSVLDHYQAALEAALFFGDSIPKYYVNFGPGVLAAFLGAACQLSPETAWFSPPQDAEGRSWEQIPLAEINPSIDETHPLWLRVCALTESAARRWKGQVAIGMTDLGGNLDVLASLIGSERLAMALLDAPEEVERLCDAIRQTWLHCYDHLHHLMDQAGLGSACWASIWAPERAYMFQSDFAYMISSNHFRQFVIPDLQESFETIPYAFYHLDGKGQVRHVDQLLALEGLRGIQWIPGDGTPPPEEWLALLKRIIDGGKRCQLYVSAQGARKIVSELGGKGFALDITDDLTPEQAQALIGELTGE